jgi:hypothetical protein
LTAAAGGSQTTRFERFTLQASTSGGGIDCLAVVFRRGLDQQLAASRIGTASLSESPKQLEVAVIVTSGWILARHFLARIVGLRRICRPSAP